MRAYIPQTGKIDYFIASNQSAPSTAWEFFTDDYIGVAKELVEKAIADDIAFLDGHPTKNLAAAN